MHLASSNDSEALIRPGVKKAWATMTQRQEAVLVMRGVTGRVNAFETTEFGIYCSDSTLVTSATSDRH